jgi:hypothetical protein
MPTLTTTGTSNEAATAETLSAASAVLLKMSYCSVLDRTADAEATMRWCMDVGLLPASQLCAKCHQDMRLDIGRKRWRCGRAKCRMERSLMKGTFFDSCKLPLRKAVRLMCFWCSRTPVSDAADMAGVSEKAASVWFKKCLEIDTKEMLVQVGQDGHGVETSLKRTSKLKPTDALRALVKGIRKHT